MMIALAAGLMACGALLAAEKEINVNKLDKNMAIVETVAADETVWIDAKDLPMEGNAYWPASGTQFVRLPPAAESNVQAAVWSLAHHTAGLQFRFTTDSTFLHLKWNGSGGLGGPTVDVYRGTEDLGWRFESCRIYLEKGDDHESKIDWKPGTPCLVNLPPYSVIRSFKVGLSKGAKIWAAPARKSGVSKPVVFYGTSITQGAWGSRPGMGFVNLIGRKLDVPVVNLGFSGNGNMEPGMIDLLAQIDASCYVIDTAHNTWSGYYGPGGRSETFLRELRKLRPDVPIVLCESTDCCQFSGKRQFAEKDAKIRAMYERLLADGIKGLSYVPSQIQYAPDDEGATDTCHPDSWGMMHIAYAYGDAIADALGLSRMKKLPVREHSPYGPAAGLSAIDTDAVKK